MISSFDGTGAGGWLWALALGAAVVGCTKLPDIEANVCGNAVVDPEEDCDTFVSTPGAVCRAPGTVGECRWDCSPDAEGKRAPCPEGWGCGTDGICRVPSGRFVPVGAPFSGHPLAILEMDGDARGDLVTKDSANLEVRFFDEEGGVSKVVTLSGAADDATAFGDLTDDGLADMALHLGGIGLGIVRATSDRTLEPVAQTSIPIAKLGEGEGMIVAEVRKTAPGQEVLAVIRDPRTGAFQVTPTDETGALFVMSHPATEIPGRIPVGDLAVDPSAPCDEIALGYAGEDRIFVHRLCVGPNQYAYDLPPIEVALPPGRTVAGPTFIADANGDGHLDLIVSALSPLEDLEIDVAFGQSDGTFHSNAFELPTLTPDGHAGTVLGQADIVGDTYLSPPLAVADVNVDGKVDLITSDSVFVSVDTQTPKPTYVGLHTALAGWGEVAVGDFNANGFPDIVAARADPMGLDFYNGVGNGLFNRYALPVDGIPGHFATGDFDGDLVQDVALSIEDPYGKAEDTFAVLFGRLQGAPEGPIAIGRFPNIRQISAGDRILHWVLYGDFVGSAPDAITDLCILTDDETTSSVAVVPGSSDRRLQSPLLLLQDRAAPALPLVPAIGRFTPGAEHRDMVVFGQDIDDAASGQAPLGAPRLWRLQGDGQGRFGPGQPFEKLGPSGTGLYTAALAVGDLDGAVGDADALDEIVFSFTAAEGQAITSRFGVARVGNDAIETEVSQLETPLATSSGALRIGDLDGDGRPEVVAITERLGIGPVEEADALNPYGQLAVIWNQGGSIEPTSAVLVPEIDPSGAWAFALVNADQDPAQEIVVSTLEGVYVVDVGNDRTFAPPIPLPGVKPASRIVSGDVDGDGVLDLALDDGEFTMVMLGVPVRP